jgi:acetolactate synthase I/II/III large subunit
LDGLDDSGAIFGRPDFASIAKGFGLRGTNVTDLSQFASLLRDYQSQGAMEIWNIPISDQVTSPSMRRVKVKGHGVI